MQKIRPDNRPQPEGALLRWANEEGKRRGEEIELVLQAEVFRDVKLHFEHDRTNP